MDYYLYKNDQNIGPLPESEVASGLQTGRFSPSDLGCRVGDSNWKDLQFFFPLETRAQPQTGFLQPPSPVYRQPLPTMSKPAVTVQAPQPVNRYGSMSDAGKIMLFESGKKSTTTAFLLCLFLGGIGAHRFYLGYTGSGGAMLAIWLCSLFLMLVLIGFVTIWITPIWAFIDLFLISGMTRQYNEELALKLGVFH